MLYYHVGNKDALYLEALETAYSDSRAAEQELRLKDMEPLQAIERLVRFTWDYFVANPEFIARLNTENLHKARNLKRSRQIASTNSPVVATVGRIPDEGVKRGLFRAGIDPLQLYISYAVFCLKKKKKNVDITVIRVNTSETQKRPDSKMQSMICSRTHITRTCRYSCA